MSTQGDRKLSRRAVLGAIGGTALGTAAAAAPVPRPRSPALILELRADPLTARFVNRGRKPVRILKPLDGSEWCWIMPHYRLSILDDRDREAALAPRCKLYGFPYTGTRWPEDYVVTIPGGGEYTRPVGHNHVLRKEGTYRVRLEYRFTPKANRTPGGGYPEGLWVGSLISNVIEVRLSPRT
jgi:hypothetical protein